MENDLWVLPDLFDLEPSYIHPSTISKLLDQKFLRIDAVLYNDRLWFSDANDPLSLRYRWQRRCSGTVCYETDPVTREVTSFDLRDGDFSGRGIQWTVLGERDGLTLVKREARTTDLDGTDYDWTGYGAWARYNIFFSRWQEGIDGFYAGGGQPLSYSAGDYSVGNPNAITARWSGLMAGIDVGFTETRGNQVLGQADLVFDNRRNQALLDVFFTDIIDTRTLEFHDDIEWYNLRVRNGVFRSGEDSNSIHGRFYGPYHQEVGGIFERNQISGSFGATRQ